MFQKFPANSRYYLSALATMETIDGRQISYLKRRFIPQPLTTKLYLEHTVVQGDRLDLIAAKYLSDPTLFWRVCDGGLVNCLDDLDSNAGRTLRIDLPESAAEV